MLRFGTRGLAGLLLTSLLLVIVSVSPALAGGLTVGGDEDGIAGGVGLGPVSGPPGSPPPLCDFSLASTTVAGGKSSRTVGSEVQYLYSRVCPGLPVALVWFAAADPALVLAAARHDVERLLPQPTPKMVWPDPDFDWAYAQVPIDFRAEVGEWVPVTATASVSNPFASASVTVQAEPVKLLFDPGDPGGTLRGECGGADPLASYNPAAPGRCSVTYINASSTAANGRSFNGELSIEWEVTYWSSTHPSFSGSLPVITTTTQFPVEVAEVKALLIHN